jgi:hypothetical protein
VVGSFSVNAAATDITIVLPSAVNITTLFGAGGQVFNTLNLTCEGVELYAL